MASSIFHLDRISILDIIGKDADTIVHNVTTNAVKTLESGNGCETFITDARGKTIGHGFLYRSADRLRFLGSPGQSGQIAEHVDRYTIREDATPVVRDDEFTALVAAPSDEELFPTAAAGATIQWQEGGVSRWEFPIYTTRWLGDGTRVALLDKHQSDAVVEYLTALGRNVEGDQQFHHARTVAAFPWYGIDIDEKNLPQEADRDAQAVSFTKGCYLGQETVARLDALGQVQRKLVRWSIQGGVPQPGLTLEAGGKTVGRLTSVTPSDQGALAIGFARRSHFDPGATATGTDPESSTHVTATVIA